MQLNVQKRLAADVMGVSPKKVVFDVTQLSEVKEAITKADIRRLVGEGVIRVKPHSQQSKGRSRTKAAQKRKGRQQGVGSRKGKKFSRNPRKALWVRNIRLQRAFLSLLREKKIVSEDDYKQLYLKAKGGFFRNKRHIKVYMEEHSMAKK